MNKTFSVMESYMSKNTFKNSNYQVLAILGEGTFGRVTKCLRKTDKKTVAIKVMKYDYVDRATQNEVSVLRKLLLHDSHKHNIVQWHRAFMDRGHLCLEFECLDKSLIDFMKESHFQPLSLKAIRPIVMQMAIALKHLKFIGIIHTDLKLENVMLVNHQHEPYRIKVIDFGLARDTSAARVGSYIQTRPYRSPEIILGLPFTEAIDIWSLGIIAASLYLAYLLYPGNSEYDMIRYIVETQGKPPNKMLNSGKKTSRFFYKQFTSTGYIWKLKTSEQVFQESGICFTERRKRKFNSLNDLLDVHAIWPLSGQKQQTFADKNARMCDLQMFVEMVKELLHLDPERRINPQQVLDHPFTKMNHMAHLYHLSYYVKSCYQHINISRKKSTVSSYRDTGVSRSLQQPVSETRQPVQQRLPPPATKSKLLVRPLSSRTTCPSQQNCPRPSTQRSRPDYFRHGHCESAQTVSVKPNLKRKKPDEYTKDISPPAKRRRIDCKDVGKEITPSSKYEKSDHGQLYCNIL